MDHKISREPAGAAPFRNGAIVRKLTPLASASALCPLKVAFLSSHDIIKAMAPDPFDLRILFDLQTRRQDIADGWWWKIAAWEAMGAPDDIRYALTLHNPGGQRILGYDNDHDRHHRHPPDRDEFVPYRFTTCAKRVEDFFADIDRHLKMLGVLS